MKSCPHCSTANADTNQFCRQCGKALDAPPPHPASPQDATVRWSGQAVKGGSLRRTLPVDVLFAAKNQALIGRAPECDVYLPHPTVSRRHALLEWHPPELRLRDLGSVNGVLLGGRPITDTVVLKENERVGIGPFMFCLLGGVIHFLDSSQSLRLEARHLEKAVWQGPGRQRKLLDDINLAVEPGEFVSLLGPSGSGKSTLMDCLNGRRPATGGKVLANGEDFYLHFDSFRQSLGYVPQRDIVHTQLSVYRALYYTARLRLPTDTGPAELRARIEEVLALMELGPHRETHVGNLSGGQIKRVSLGAELLARPCLLYIDEATSGLDAGTEARMMHLFRQLADEGRSVICITHNVDNVDLCNLILVLARGKLVYFGPPAETRPYFGVSRVSEIYDRLTLKDPARWEEEFAGCSLYDEFVRKRLAVQPADTLAPGAPAGKAESGSGALPAAPTDLSLSHSSPSLSVPDLRPPPPRWQRPPLWHQFGILTARYAELIWKDRNNLILLLLQAPVVAVFILLGFINKPYQQKVLAPRVLEPHEREVLGRVLALTRRYYDKIRPTLVAAGGKANNPVRVVRDQFQKVAAAQGLTPLQRAPLEYVFSLGERAYDANRERIENLNLRGRADYVLGVLEEIYQSDAPVVPDRMIVNPRYTYMLLFLVVLIVLWFGCNNASKEIVKEEAIYGRERAVNLGIRPYLASKFLILSVITVIQTLLLMVIVYGVLRLLGWHLGQPVPDPHYYLAYPEQFGVLAVLAMTSVAMGLLLSACVATPDRANALLPYVLIPQIILGGGILAIRSGPLYWIAMLSPAYWAFRAVHTGVSTVLPKDFPSHMDYAETVWLPVVALLVQLGVLLFLTAWFLRRKDVHKA